MKKILSLLILLFPFYLYAQEVTLKTGVDKSTIHIGDYIKYYIDIEYQKGIKIVLPAPGANLGKFDIKDYNVVVLKSKNSNKERKKIEYIITTYFLGDFEIPPIKIKYITKDKVEKSIDSDSVLIKVVPLERKPTDKDDIRDIKPPYYFVSYFWLYVLIIFLVIGAGILLYIFYFKKKWGNKEMVSAEKTKEPELPEDEEALKRIDELVNKGYIEKGLIKEFYFELSEIIKKYINRRYKIVTLERTSSEILRDMKKFLTKKEYGLFEKFFIDTDMVKFAKSIPSKTELKNIVPFVKNLIEITRIKKVVDNEIS